MMFSAGFDFNLLSMTAFMLNGIKSKILEKEESQIENKILGSMIYFP